ncbi:putative Meiotic nuclear division protein 1 like protein [Monoraphidium neglectum]|uniref:Meiotic nuclear division protein 1 homolog n=1 Tax=Monoraphidium neglectum TaxID=145388 RepID=A0A0D2MI13_9CHLO|nr:putative Meiotic nuclear division protein 1 like protein [Monoraphidium neglectum]KIZ00342.1 putative Meiotic nuclear division protein 1 like protein [Monoraphidium neglectum]|eukprot:XP_013899361.1 putative Meiotic nuclear division protein 1 like protein [Monoraphidium neglectum]
MSKKRGLSLEEKRDKVLEVFHEAGDVFVLKDVEKIASKRGVVLQSVKEVLQSLVDDDLVHQERIGASNYFWSFPAEASTKVVNDLQKSKETLTSVRKRRAEAAAAVEGAKAGKEDLGDRAELMQEVKRLQALLQQQAADLQAFADSDPELVAQMRTSTQVAKEGANRWLDNVYAMQSWLKKKFEGNEGAVRTLFEEHGVTENLDYLE